MYVMMSCGGSSGSERWTSCPRQRQRFTTACPLRDAVERLPQELRAVVALRYFAGYTLAETAEILGIPPGTVSTRQRRALALLRLELSEEEGGQV